MSTIRRLMNLGRGWMKVRARRRARVSATGEPPEYARETPGDPQASGAPTDRATTTERSTAPPTRSAERTADRPPPAEADPPWPLPADRPVKKTL